MVSVEGKKYSCETCIKGHRASSCKHHDRPLFEIKKKGRPVTQCEHCRELRKTKQIHVKCLCDGKQDAAPQVDSDVTKPKKGSKTLSACATFPNGLSKPLGSSVALQSEPSSDSESGAIDPGHFTILKPASAAAHQAIAERPLTRRLSDGSNDDLGAIHEMNARNHPHLRRVLPRLSSGHAIPTGAGHETSSHVVSAPHHSSHHGNMFYSPYGRAYESTHVDPSPEASPECVAPHIDQSGVPPERFRPFPAATSASSSPQFSQPPFGTVTSWNQNQLANNFEESTRPYTSPSSQTLPSKDPFIPTFDISAIDEWMSQLPDFAMQASDTNNPSPPLGDVDPAIVQAFFASWNDNVYSVPTTGTEPPDGGWYGGNDKCAAGQCRCIGDWCGQGREGVESPSRNSVTFAVSGERAPCASEKGSLTGNFSSSRPEEANRAAFVVNIPLPRNHSGTADRLHLSIEPRQSFSRASSTSSSHSSQPSSHGSFGSVDYANIPESHSFDSIPGMAFIDEFDPSNSKARTFS